VYKHADGREQKNNPSKPEGIIALANAIPDMRAMTKVILSRNGVGLDGAAAICNAVKSNVHIHDTCFVSFEQI
jgi:hypothetical protein